MKLDIHSAIVTVIIISIIGAAISVWNGVRAMRKRDKVSYYRLRRRLITTGLRAFVFAVGLGIFAFLMGRFGETISYNFFKPSASPSPTLTISLTPSITLTPTISLTPTITPTQAISFTPTTTGTPFLPPKIQTQFKSIVTPNPAAIFSPLVFSLSVNNYKAITPQTVFQNPLSRIFFTYTYDGMSDGVQWTEIWYLNGKLVKYETSIWDSGTGGSGQGNLTLPADQWLPGTYQLVFFVGMEWKVLGEFRVTGNPPTATISPTPSLTGTPTMKPGATHTGVPSSTFRPTDTRWPSQTPTKR
jgi:hypothetical protein